MVTTTAPDDADVGAEGAGSAAGAARGSSGTTRGAGSLPQPTSSSSPMPRQLRPRGLDMRPRYRVCGSEWACFGPGSGAWGSGAPPSSVAWQGGAARRAFGPDGAGRQATLLHRPEPRELGARAGAAGERDREGRWFTCVGKARSLGARKP